MSKKFKVTGAVLCAAAFVSLLALSGCGEQPVEPSVPSVPASSTISQLDPASSSELVSSAPADPSQVSSSAPSSVSSTVSSSLPPSTVSGAVNESARVDSSYFDDAVFIGDSVSYKLQLYTINQRKTDADLLGKAQFLTAGSLGSHNALWDVSRSDSVHPSYEGKKALLEDSVAAMKAKKVYIMLGMNDVGLYGVDDSVKSMETLIGKILEKSPDAKIYVQSATPKMKAFEGPKLNNATLTEYNQKMAQLCQEKGYHFIDVASVFKANDGTLIAEYCSDPYPDKPNNMGIHFTDQGCKVWIDYLYTHTA